VPSPFGLGSVPLPGVRAKKLVSARIDVLAGAIVIYLNIAKLPELQDGRTSGYDAEIAQTICERLVNGESLRAICADPAMPARATVFRWLARNQEFRQLYALARQCQAEDLADEILKIADDSSRDYKKKIGADGEVTRVVDPL
jgi:hypothetical protein